MREITGKARSRLLGVASGLTLACALHGFGAVAHAEEVALRWGVSMDIASLDPVYSTNNWEYVTTANIYDALVWPDRERGVRPLIAESWEISEDALEYSFTIRDDVKFHDGTPVTAEDVVFSWTRMMTMNGPAAAYFRALKPQSISLVDDKTVKFTLENKDSSFIKKLLTFKIVNKDLVLANLKDGPHGEFKDYGAEYARANSVGSGPYTVDDYRPGELVRMTRFADYSLVPASETAPDVVEFQITPEMATIAAKLRAGEIEVADWSVPLTAQRQIQADGRFKLQEDSQPTAWYIIMNNAKPPLDDVNVRKAVAHAYDTNTVTQHILGAGGPLAGPVPASLLGNCEGITTYEFDLDKAKDYLAKSKYSADELSKLTLDVGALAGSERFNNISLLLATNLKKIGLNPQLTTVRWADLGQAQTKPETAFHFTVFYDGARVPDPTVFLTYYTKEGWGDAYPPGGIYYENPEVTRLYETGVASTDPEVQRQSYCDAVKLIAEDSPSVFSHTDVRFTSHWNYVNGFPDGEGALFYELRFDRWGVDTSSPDYQANKR